MPRRGAAKRIKPSEDAVYGSIMISKLINRSMYDGKKSVAEKEVYTAMKLIAEKTEKDAITVFNTAIENIKPDMEVRARRVGGAAYQIPVQVRGERKDSLAIRWIIMAARARSNSEYHTFAEKIAAEIMDAAKGEGGAVRKKAEVEKVAESNKAFSHFKW
jgi:small subunit ribosomal protein S7